MIAVALDKAKAECFLDCIENGKPIPPQDVGAGWTVDDLLMLAGAIRFTVLSRGQSPDIRAVVEWFSELAGQIKDGKYDAEFEPHLEALVTSEGATKVVHVTQGLKNKPQPRKGRR